MDPESGRRSVADKEAQIGTGNVAGITFGVDKWKYPYNATVEHTMEFNRRKNGGFGVTSDVAESVFGPNPAKSAWDEGPVRGILSWFGMDEMLGRGDSGASYVSFMPSAEEFRKNSPPLPLVSKYTIGWGAFGAAHALSLRYQMRLPFYAAVHRTAFTIAAYAWIGYQYQKFVYMRSLGEFKYALDFADRHSDIIYKQEPSKFGDPEILEHYVKLCGKGHQG